jgi:hypothetical protein
MLIFRAFLAVCLVLTQVGCTADILPWPGFESKPAIFSYAEQIPAAEVSEQVRCELAEFLLQESTAQGPDPHTSKEGPDFLDVNTGAQVQLKLTTDLQGSVTWLGVNLAGLGLGAIAALVTQANSTPSLQLKAQGKTTQTSQVDFVVPQTLDNLVYEKVKPPIPLKINNVPVMKDGKPVLVDYKKVDLPKSLQLPKDKDCSHGLKYAWFRLWLSDALEHYKNRLGPDVYGPGAAFADHVCQPKLTISTQFQLLFDISAGTNILQAVPILLPVSGLNVDASPDYTHFIQIIFALRPTGKFDVHGDPIPNDPDTLKRVAACDALKSTNPPSHT